MIDASALLQTLIGAAITGAIVWVWDRVLDYRKAVTNINYLTGVLAFNKNNLVCFKKQLIQPCCDEIKSLKEKITDHVSESNDSKLNFEHTLKAWVELKIGAALDIEKLVSIVGNKRSRKMLGPTCVNLLSLSRYLDNVSEIIIKRNSLLSFSRSLDEKIPQFILGLGNNNEYVDTCNIALSLVDDALRYIGGLEEDLVELAEAILPCWWDKEEINKIKMHDEYTRFLPDGILRHTLCDRTQNDSDPRRTDVDE